jgi:hypothetical protein
MAARTGKDGPMQISVCYHDNESAAIDAWRRRQPTIMTIGMATRALAVAAIAAGLPVPAARRGEPIDIAALAAELAARGGKAAKTKTATSG